MILKPKKTKSKSNLRPSRPVLYCVCESVFVLFYFKNVWALIKQFTMLLVGFVSPLKTGSLKQIYSDCG